MRKPFHLLLLPLASFVTSHVRAGEIPDTRETPKQAISDGLDENLRDLAKSTSMDSVQKIFSGVKGEAGRDFFCHPDLVRILEKGLQKALLVAPGSMAAQSGTPQSPRVVLPIFLGNDLGEIFDPRDLFNIVRGKAAKVAAVLTGGHGGKNANRADVLEGAIFTRNPNQMQLFEVHFDSIAGARVETDPKDCKSCHESNSPYRSGSYPIMEPRPWVSFLNRDMSGALCNADEVSAYTHLNAQLKKAGAKKPYSCLSRPIRDSEVLGDFSVTDITNHIDAINRELTDSAIEKRAPRLVAPTPGRQSPIDLVDQSLSDFSTVQVAEKLRQMKEIEPFKPFLVGFELCSFDRGYGELENWIPQKVMEKFAELSAVDPRLRHAQEKKLLAGFGEAFDDLAQQDDVRLEALKKFNQNPDENDFPGFSENVTACQRAVRRSTSVQQIKAAIAQNPFYGAFVADSVLHGVRDVRIGTNPLMRFVLEGSGLLSMAEWGMRPRELQRYDRDFTGYGPEIVKGDRELEKLFESSSIPGSVAHQLLEGIDKNAIRVKFTLGVRNDRTFSAAALRDAKGERPSNLPNAPAAAQLAYVEEVRIKTCNQLKNMSRSRLGKWRWAGGSKASKGASADQPSLTDQ